MAESTRAAEQRLLILGAGSFALEVADLIEQVGKQQVAGFVESLDRKKVGKSLVERPVYWIDQIAEFTGQFQAVAAIGSPSRRVFLRTVAEMGFSFATVVHPSAVVSPTSVVGAGSIVSAAGVIASHTRVGRHVVLNRGCLVGHHTTIGDCCTISPGANIAGSVNIGAGTFVGMGALVLNNLEVGPDSVVAAGAVVTRDVPAGSRVMGIPARVVGEKEPH